MLKFEDWENPVTSVPTIKTNKKIEYLNIEAAFDIETTSTYVDGRKTAFMYIWMFGIGLGNENVYGRDWESFQTLCDELQETYELNKERRLVIYVHNLGYEFQFMRKYFEWESVFAVGERKPIKALTTQGIEFRDSYILSGYSLENTAKNLQNHAVRKLTGDLDYSLIRTQNTLMDEQELEYCNNDIDIILAYINEQIMLYENITKIPLTNTGRVRDYVRHNCYYTSKNHKKSGKGKYYRYRSIMNDLTLTVEDYQQMVLSFMGGFTHANALHSGKVLENVSSVDFTSSYPAVMLAEQYPMSRPKRVTINSIDELEEKCMKYCLSFDIMLENVRPIITQENYISESKCYILEKPVINNGRVHQADRLAMTITNVDYDILKQCYEWDGIQVSNVNQYHKGYLPKSIIESILSLYEDKTVLKGVKGKETEYLLSKGMLNSVYGMSVTSVVKDEHHYSNGWTIEPADITDQIEQYNTSKNRFLYYPWGVWVTAYARRNLWTGIIAMGEDYVYSDTDSIKFLNFEDHKTYLNAYNDSTVNKLEAMCRHYKIDPKRLAPTTQEGVTKMIGVWDYEGTYSRFKTLGAKRYLVEEEGKLELTVAGLSKQNGLQYLLEQTNGDNSKVFDLFNDDLYIPANRTGKMTHTYIDDSQEVTVTDYQGNTTTVHTKSGIHLENAEFTLSIAKQYGTFLHNLSQGYIYKGVKHI